MTQYQNLDQSKLHEQLEEEISKLEAASTEDEKMLLIHDLHVHQIELEMQNRELREAQLHIEAARDRYADLYDFAPIGYLSLDSKGVIREINLTASSMLGLERSPLIGQPFVRWIIDNQKPEFYRHLRDVFIGKNNRFTAEFSVKDHNNNIKMICMESITSVPVPGEENLCRIALIDITKQKQIEMALVESEQNLRRTFEQSPLGAAIVSLDYHFQRVNQALCRITGYSADELKQRLFTDITHPDDLQKDLENAEQLIAGTIELYQTDKRYISKDGGVVYARLFLRIIKDNDGNPLYFFPLIEDITQKRYTESALRDLEQQLGIIADTVPALIAYVDNSYHYRFVNKAFEFWFGYAYDEIIGKHVRFILGKDIYRKIKPNIETAMNGDEVSFETLIPYRNDSERYVMVNYIPHWNDHESVKGIIIVIRDITEQKTAERNTFKYKEEAARIDRLNTMGEMASSLAHEINQPLCAISNYAHACTRMMAAGSKDTESLKAAIESIATQAHRASDIIRSIRGFIRKGESGFSKLDINTIIQDTVKLIEPNARIMKITISVELEDGLPLVQGNAVQIEQVILNIIKNAIEAIGANGAHKAIIITSEVDYDNDEVVVSISDTGAGMDMSISDHIYDAFVTSKPQGTGMGLSVSRSILETHGGRLWWLPQAGGGTIFKFALPIVRSK